MLQMLARYDAANPGAVKRLVVGGASLRLFPQDVLEACYKTSSDLYDQLSAQNPRFKKLADSFLSFRADQYLWWQVAEYSFDNFMIRQRHAKDLRFSARRYPAPPNARRRAKPAPAARALRIAPE